MFAGMESSQIFHEKREALIEKKYNADEIQQRILFVSSNPCNPFSLPVFHGKKIYKAWVISAPVRGACIIGTHTAACLCNGSAHAGKLFPRNTEPEKSANDYLTQSFSSNHLLFNYFI